MLRANQIVKGPGLETSRALFISDLHGELPILNRLLDEVRYQPGIDQLFLLGDLIEKGRDSLGTLRKVMALSEIPGVAVLQGNNDSLAGFFDSRLNNETRMKYLNSRSSILSEMAELLGVSLSADTDFTAFYQLLRQAFKPEMEFLESLPLILSGPDYTAAHSSLQNEREPRMNQEDRVLKDNAFLFQAEPCFQNPLIVGHMPAVALTPQIGSCAVQFLKERNLFAIDGGCGMHRHGQLNALIIENGDFAHPRTASADLLEKRTVIQAQAGTPAEDAVFVRYFESEIEVLSECRDILTVRQTASGKVLEIPRSALRIIEGKTHCFNSTSYWLPLKPGERVSVIQEWSDRIFCKHQGTLGWVSPQCLGPAIADEQKF